MLSDWKMVVYTVVCVGAMLFGMFRLDEVFAKRRPGDKPPRKRPMGNDAHGHPMYSDPDGKAWKRRQR